MLTTTAKRMQIQGGIFSPEFRNFADFMHSLTVPDMNLEQFARRMESVYGAELAILRRADILSSPEGTAKRPAIEKVPLTVGEKLYPSMTWERLQEYNRTMMFCYLFYLLSHDKYEQFTACQGEAVRLSRQSFSQMVVLAESVINMQNANQYVNILVMSDLLMADASIHDIGKVRGIAEMYRTISGTKGAVANHDEPLVYLLEHAADKFSPTFMRMTKDQRSFLLQVLGIQYNLGQLPQGENLAGNLLELTNVNRDVLNFWILKSFLDIAGAAGASIQNGSVIATEPFYKGFKIAIESIKKIMALDQAQDVYDWHLNERATLIGIDISTAENYALARLACINRIFDPAIFQTLREAFQAIEKSQQRVLIDELNRGGIRDLGILSYYCPALFNNLKTSEQGKQSGLFETLKFGLNIFAKTFVTGRTFLNKATGYGIFTLNIYDVAEAAKNPLSLENATFYVESAGQHGILRIKKPSEAATFQM